MAFESQNYPTKCGTFPKQLDYKVRSRPCLSVGITEKGWDVQVPRYLASEGRRREANLIGAQFSYTSPRGSYFLLLISLELGAVLWNRCFKRKCKCICLRICILEFYLNLSYSEKAIIITRIQWCWEFGNVRRRFGNKFPCRMRPIFWGGYCLCLLRYTISSLGLSDTFAALNN